MHIFKPDIQIFKIHKLIKKQCHDDVILTKDIDLILFLSLQLATKITTHKLAISMWSPREERRRLEKAEVQCTFSEQF